MIRRATIADYEALTEMGRQFFAATGYSDIVAFDDISFRVTLDNLLAGDSVCLVAELDGQVVGAAGALAYPFYFNAAHKTGQEVFWWINPGHRGGTIGARLFAALESWAREAGCQSFSMIALATVNPDMIGAIYLKSGYRASEHTYIKEL